MNVFLDPESHRRLMRRIVACTHTMYGVADEIEEVDSLARHSMFASNMIDYVSADQRADLIIAVENLVDVVAYVTEKTRDMGWKHTVMPVPDDGSDYLD